MSRPQETSAERDTDLPVSTGLASLGRLADWGDAARFASHTPATACRSIYGTLRRHRRPFYHNT